ncbi:MAG: VanW family protein [bacterium]|nr:VanW family protein [bacterium]
MHRKLGLKNNTFSRRTFLVGIAVFFLACLLPLCSIFAYFAYTRNRFLAGVSISGISVGRKTTTQARDMLENRLRLFSLRMELAPDALLEKSGKPEKIVLGSLRELGVSVLFDDALHDAFAIGHRGSFLNDLRETLARKGRSSNIPLRIAHDDNILRAYLLEKFGGTREMPATNATVFFKENRIMVTPSRDGSIIDRVRLKEALAERLATLQDLPIILEIVPDRPRIDTRDAKEIASRVENILGSAPYFLFGNNKRLAVPDSQLREWINFIHNPSNIEVVFSREAIEEYLLSISPSMAREARDVTLGADANGVMFVALPSENALRLNIQKTAGEMTSHFEKMKRNISVIMDETPAHINELLLKERNITHLVGRGESSFAGSPKNRIQNIRVASEKYRGMFIEQGEEFSFNAHLGDIDAAGGYVPELVIKNNKLIPEYGGGICQVSTTLFRAAVWAGLKITKRANHSIPVRYYGAPGFDATVYPPSPDLAFVNTATGTLFIQPRIEGTKLAFELYGQRSEKEVKVEGPRVVESKRDGSIRTVVTQKVFEGGVLVQQKSFWSLYKSPELYKIERNPLE